MPSQEIVVAHFTGTSHVDFILEGPPTETYEATVMVSTFL